MTETPELRFFDAIVRAVHARGENWSLRVVDAAVAALVDDLDSPSLRILAGQPANDEVATERLLLATCEELGIPHPSRGERWVPRVIDGRGWERIASDSIRFAIEPSEASAAGVELRVFVNGVIVSDGFIVGLDPVDIEHLVIADDRERPLLSWCPRCGESDCEWVVVHRSLDGETVHWDWIDDVAWGTNAGVSFRAAEYEAAIERVRADRSWEQPEDVVRRLIVVNADHVRLRRNGLRLEHVGRDRGDATRIEVGLASAFGPGSHQGRFQARLGFGWDPSDTESVAQEIIHILARDPREWRATYHMVDSRGPDVPAVAGPLWRPWPNSRRSPVDSEDELGPIASEPRWAPWLDTYVFDPFTRDKTLREIDNIDIRADNAKIIARALAATAILALGASMLLGVVTLANGTQDQSVWTRLLLLTFGFIAIFGLGLTIWRIGGGSVARTEVARKRAIEALENDSRRMLPRTVLRDFYVSDRVSDSDVWDAAQQLHALDAAWADYAELSQRRNLTPGQELEILEAEASARIVLDAVGELLNPGSAPAEERW